MPRDMPEKGEVAVFEDRSDVQLTIKGILRDDGHTVVAQAQSVEEADVIIKAIENGDLHVDAVLIDGNLDPQDSETQHGAVLAQRLREIGIPIIEIASTHCGFGDYSSPKDEYFRNLAAIVTGL